MLNIKTLFAFLLALATRGHAGELRGTISDVQTHTLTSKDHVFVIRDGGHH